MLDLTFLKPFFTSTRLLFNEPMRNHTSFKVGGAASAMLIPKDESDITVALYLCEKHKIPCFIMGNGTNLLVSDTGISGLVIKIAGNMNKMSLFGSDEIMVGAGRLLTEAAAFALSHSLSGMEFASGIPGTIGGAVYMNAGAYGREIKDILSTAYAITNDVIWDMRRGDKEFAFDHRSSIFQTNGGIIISAVFKLTKGDYTQIENEMKALNAKRKAKQPLDKPSAGSTFKKPNGHYAGELIAKCGLAGYSIGGARVSEKHCGFIINDKNAAAADVYNLIEYVKDKVHKDCGVLLKPEVQLIGEF